MTEYQTVVQHPSSCLFHFYCRKSCALLLVVFFSFVFLSDFVCLKIFLLYIHCLLEIIISLQLCGVHFI